MNSDYREFLASKFDILMEDSEQTQPAPKLSKAYKRLYSLECTRLGPLKIYCIHQKDKVFNIDDCDTLISLADYLYPSKICLCTKSITDKAKEKLVEKRVNYIALNSDIYFPDAFFMYTKSKFMDKAASNTTVSFPEKLTPLSNKITILYMQRLINKNFTSRDISLKTQATTTAIANATKSLIERNLLSAEKIGKSWEYTFKVTSKELWSLRNSLLVDPIRARKVINVKEAFFSDNPLILTGESAVSQYTLLSEPQTPIYGIDAKRISEFEQKYLDKKSSNSIILEVFYYQPLSKTVSSVQVIDRMELIISKPTGLPPRVAASYEEIEDEIMERLVRYG